MQTDTGGVKDGTTGGPDDESNARSQGRTWRDQCEEILGFLKVFVDKCHHAKEEDHLFPALERAGIPKEGGPIGAMLHDHRMGRDFIRAMGEAVPGVKRGDRSAAGRFVRYARGYFERVEEGRVGHGKHEQFHRKMDRLKSIYGT